MFLFNKLDSLLALFIQRQCHCFWEGRLILNNLVLESHPDYSHVISDSDVLYQYFHTFHQEICKKHCQAEVRGKMWKQIDIFFQFQIVPLKGSTKSIIIKIWGIQNRLILLFSKKKKKSFPKSSKSHRVMKLLKCMDEMEDITKKLALRKISVGRRKPKTWQHGS